jgi:hypothetical protein
LADTLDDWRSAIPKNSETKVATLKKLSCKGQ